MMKGQFKILRANIFKAEDRETFEKLCIEECNNIKEITIAPMKITWLYNTDDVLVCIIEWCI